MPNDLTICFLFLPLFKYFSPSRASNFCYLNFHDFYISLEIPISGYLVLSYCNDYLFLYELNLETVALVTAILFNLEQPFNWEFLRIDILNSEYLTPSFCVLIAKAL